MIGNFGDSPVILLESKSPQCCEPTSELVPGLAPESYFRQSGDVRIKLLCLVRQTPQSNNWLETPSLGSIPNRVPSLLVSPCVLGIRLQPWLQALHGAVPHFFGDSGDEGDGKAHCFSTAHTANAVDVVLRPVRKCHVYYVWELLDVYTPCCHICADEEPDISSLKALSA